MHDPVHDIKVRVRCPECRTTFRERIQRLVHSDRLRCPCCEEDLRFHGIGHHHQHENIEAYIRHVESRTCHPHYRHQRE